MDRPYIVCHILSSLDGRIDGGFFSMEETMAVYPEFGRIRECYHCDAVLNGAVTAAEIYHVPTMAVKLEARRATPREDFAANTDAKKYAVVIDAEGKLDWNSGGIERRGEKLHVIVILMESVSDAHLARLREAGVSYILAGEKTLDLPLAMRRLKSEFGIDRILLSGGGVVNWTMLQAGLIDELSLVIAPVAEGRRDVASVFDESLFLSSSAPVGFDLKESRPLSGGGLWLNYIPKHIDRQGRANDQRKDGMDMEQVLMLSQAFWKALEVSDTAAMRSICDPRCFFVHIGGNCDLDREMAAFDDKVFQPTEITLHAQEAKDYGDTAVVISDVDYGLLLDGKPTTHHFSTTEVFQKQEQGWRLIQFTFTALVF